MPLALAILVGCQLVGEVLRETLRIPLPGPLIGMFLLAFILVANRRGSPAPVEDPRSSLRGAASALISNMGLLFVPAGVGVIVQATVLRAQWLPILMGLVVSTVLGLIVTGLVMQHVTRFMEARRAPLGSPAPEPR